MVRVPSMFVRYHMSVLITDFSCGDLFRIILGRYQSLYQPFPYIPTLPLYTDAIVQQYRGKRRDENPPHIFVIAERAWTNMGEERENQSILIT